MELLLFLNACGTGLIAAAPFLSVYYISLFKEQAALAVYEQNRLEKELVKARGSAKALAAFAKSHDDCPICMEPPSKWSGRVIAKCGHQTCMPCFIRWRAECGVNCPICRRNYL